MNNPSVKSEFTVKSLFKAGKKPGVISKCVVGGNENAPKTQFMNALKVAGNNLGNLVQKIAGTRVVQVVGNMVKKTPSIGPKQTHAKP